MAKKKEQAKKNTEEKKQDEKAPVVVEKRKVSAKMTDASSSPQKMRLVVNLIRGKNVNDALEILTFTRKKAADQLIKLLKSAVANAESLYGLNPDGLFISRVEVGDGVKLPRYRIASRGRVNKILKRRSIINIELMEK